jgi:hypothetical protein
MCLIGFGCTLSQKPRNLFLQFAVQKPIESPDPNVAVAVPEMPIGYDLRLCSHPAFK